MVLAAKTPMAPPAWALLERDLLRFNSQACERFAEKYVDERGYLAHTVRWGTLDGPTMPSSRAASTCSTARRGAARESK